MHAASLSDAWEAKAAEWAAWARTPGVDEFFERLNRPSFLSLIERLTEPRFQDAGGRGVAGAVRDEPYFLPLRCRLER